MPRITDLDTFIQRSASILEARPDTTRLSLTYKHQVRKVDPTREASPEADEEDDGAAQPILYAKTFDPVSGVCFRIKITKAKQLNRLLSALGPRGVEITKVTKKKRANKKAKLDKSEDVKMEDAAPLAEASTAIVREKGFALIMSNTEYVEKEETPAPETAKEVKEEKKEKKDGKKKGKKRK